MIEERLMVMSISKSLIFHYESLSQALFEAANGLSFETVPHSVVLSFKCYSLPLSPLALEI
jgi:hypothetical protein